MNDSEIKLKLFQQIDSLGKEQLLELYGVIKNFLNRKDDTETWNDLTVVQKNGIEYGLAELDGGEGIKHNAVMEELRRKYGI